MWGLESLGIPFNADGSITVPFWAACVAAGLVVVLFVLALVRTGLAGTLVFLALIGFGGWAVWSWTEYDRTAERRVLETRLSTLEALAMAPGSSLACLDGVGGETVEGACERGVFATPEAAASAVSYTSSRLTLLNDALGFAARRDPAFELALDNLRAGLELDRFGVVAHLLTVKKNCSADRCDALRAFRDAGRIRANMKENTFDSHLARAAPAWGTRPVARTDGGADQTTGRAPLPPGYNLPSSSSIPPVSIMANEPTAAPPPPQAAPSPPPRRSPPARPALRERAPQTNTANPPVQLAPSTRVQ
jgi:hypothetical protein